MNLLELLFWISVSVVAYTYFIYPGLLFLVSKLRKTVPLSFDNEYLPEVALVVCVYNEEEVIKEKLLNTSSIDYPRDRIRFVFGSDGSTDGTNKILGGYKDESFDFRFFQNRRGKASLLNDLVPSSHAEVIVLSDANTLYDSLAVRRLVRHFVDNNIGGVCGELMLKADNHTAGGFGEGQYWKYENILKRFESDISTTLGGVGALYAIRKKLFVPLPTSKTIMDDFLIPLSIIKQGYKMKYDGTAIAYEKASNSIKGEFRRKVRIGAANFHGFGEFWPLLSPRYGFISFALWSHKVMRWLVPFFLLAIMVSTLKLAGDASLYTNVAIGEGVFVFAAFIGYLLERWGFRASLFALPYYFLVTNAALLVGFFKFLLGRQLPTWEVVR